MWPVRLGVVFSVCVERQRSVSFPSVQTVQTSLMYIFSDTCGSAMWILCKTGECIRVALYVQHHGTNYVMSTADTQYSDTSANE